SVRHDVTCRGDVRLSVMFQRFVFWSSAVFLIVAGAWGAGVRPARALAQGAESTIDKAILDAMRWRSIGPLRGGRSIAVSGVKGRPKEGYFGAVGGGLWKTIDGGLSWNPVTDGQLKSSSVGAVAVSESNPDVVYIGMGESCIRGNIMPGDGVYKSTDGGESWKEITRTGGLPQGLYGMMSIAISGADSNRVYALVENDKGGLYSSDDAGATWKLVNEARSVRQRAFYYTHAFADPNNKDV